MEFGFTEFDFDERNHVECEGVQSEEFSRNRSKTDLIQQKMKRKLLRILNTQSFDGKKGKQADDFGSRTALKVRHACAQKQKALSFK